eukprot:gene20090-26807_t
MLSLNPQAVQGFSSALFVAEPGTFSMLTLSLYSALFWFLACVTRLFAEVLIAMGVPNVDPGMYALLGSAAFLGGLLRMSASMALILMEMTQSPTQLPFLMLTLVVAKQVGDQFNYGVFEQQMMLKAFQYVGIDEEAAAKAKLSAANVMSQNTRSTTLYNVETAEVLAQALETNKDLLAFPVTMLPYEDDGANDFLGMVSRARANVAALLAANPGSDCIELNHKVEVAPIIIPTNMPLPFIYRIVNAEGFNHIPVIRYHGRLEGMISRQELVDIQNKTLDEFHMQDMMTKMSEDIEQGKILRSMNLTDNIHAARFKEGAKKFQQTALRFVKNPVKATQDYLEEEDQAIPDQQNTVKATQDYLEEEDQAIPDQQNTVKATQEYLEEEDLAIPDQQATQDYLEEEDQAILDQQEFFLTDLDVAQSSQHHARGGLHQHGNSTQLSFHGASSMSSDTTDSNFEFFLTDLDVAQSSHNHTRGSLHQRGNSTQLSLHGAPSMSSDHHVRPEISPGPQIEHTRYAPLTGADAKDRPASNGADGAGAFGAPRPSQATAAGSSLPLPSYAAATSAALPVDESDSERAPLTGGTQRSDQP